MTPKRETSNRSILSAAHHNYNKGLNAHAFFKVHDKTISEDLVQDTFIKTWRYLVRGGKIELMKAFLYHILNDLIIDEYRKSKATSLDVLLEKGFNPSADDSEKLLNILDGKGAILLIQRLPKKYQKVIRMRYIQDLSLEEMSMVTGQTKSTLSVQAHRGLEKLKSLYNQSY